MSLLTVVQNACEDLDISVPTVVVGNTNTQVQQLLRLTIREGKDLASRYLWNKLSKEATFTLTTSTRDQGLLTDIASDIDYIVNETIWNRTLDEPIFGPMSAMERQALKAFPVTGPYQRYWIEEGKLYVDPAPSSEDSCAFQYKSVNWCQSSGGTAQSAWAADTDTGILDENLMELGLLWRWLRRKGLDYSEEFSTYERRVMDAIARDGTKPRITLDAEPFDRYPGVFVPQGSWNL